MKPKKILISGAGIAGPTLAYWLHRSGHEVTVVEKAPAPRKGGQNIDVSDSAVDIVRMMGIEEEILRHNTTEQGLAIVDGKEKVVARFPKGAALGFTSKYEILRGDLADLLSNLTSSRARYRFGLSIDDVTETEHGLSVTFSDQNQEEFDLLIAADGVSSSTRKLVLGPGQPYKFLGVYTSYLTIPRDESDTQWARWYNAPGGRVLLLRPDNHGTTRASFNVWHDGPPEAHFSRTEAIQWIRDRLRGAGWKADRIARDIEFDKDIYLGPVSQVRLPSWSKGRVVFVGDAAYCPTPFTGMGTTLAVIGAYVLAGELSRNDDHERAFAEYERVLRPFVTKVQKVIPGQFRWVYPQTKIGVRIFNSILSVFSGSIAQGLASLARVKPKEFERKFKLPNYDKMNQALRPI